MTCGRCGVSKARRIDPESFVGAPETILARTASTAIAIIFFVCLSPLYVRASEPPSPPAYGVRMEQAWIPMKDGVRLAATLYICLLYTSDAADE